MLLIRKFHLIILLATLVWAEKRQGIELQSEFEDEYLPYNQHDSIIDFTVRIDHLEEDVREVVMMTAHKLQKGAGLKKEDIELSRMTIGCINYAFKAKIGSFLLMVRVYGSSGSNLMANRDKECLVLSLSKSYNFGPEMYLRFKNGFTLEFLPGRMLEPDELSTQHMSTTIAAEMAKWHKIELPQHLRAKVMANVWDIMDTWIEISSTVSLDVDDISKEINAVKSKLNTEEYNDLVFSHNDLNHGNCIYNEEVEKLLFVDYEFAGINFRYFDIANHFCEWAGLDLNFDNYPTLEEQNFWLKHYVQALEGPSLDANTINDKVQSLQKKVDQYQLVSHLFWGLWGRVMDRLIDSQLFDYKKYSTKRIARYHNIKKTISSDEL